jgi:type I restriction enzyme S subunit
MNNNAAGKQDVKPVLTPKLRFPEFRDSSGWEELPLSELVGSLDAGVSVNSGDRPANESEIGVLKTSAVTNGIFEPQENKVVFDEIEIGRVREAVSEDTIIISRMNTPALVGANAYVEKSLENIFLPDRLWAAKSKLGTSMRFVAFILGSDKGRAALSKLAKGSSGSMKNITKPDVLAFLVMAPSRAEQQRISDCLTSLDEVIAAQSQKLAALKTHKKGLMQQLFPREGETIPRLRFPEFQDAPEWEMKSIGQLGEVVTGSTPSTARAEYYGGDRLFVSPADISDDRFINMTKTTLTTLGFGETRPIKANSILFVCIGSTIGKIAQNRHECATNQQINSVVPNSDNSHGFVYYALSGVVDKIANLAGIQAVPIVNKSLFSSVELAMPKLPEQTRIADCLSSLDETIFAHTQRLVALKTHKQGLMQQLFPSPTDVEA